MAMVLRPLALAALLPMLAACAQVERQADASADRVPPARVTGEAVSCINTSLIQRTRVHDDRTIDFDMGGGRIYRNTLPSGCHSLGFDRRFAYQPTAGRLCSVDAITIIRSDGSRGASCGLGEFVPMELERG